MASVRARLTGTYTLALVGTMLVFSATLWFTRRSAVSRELQDEVGQRPVRIEPMGGLYVAPGYTTEYIHLFVCTELQPSKFAADDDEDIEVESRKLDDQRHRAMTSP